jgi:eukaryotic translation initiation factor 2C
MSAHEATFMTTLNGTESEITVENYFKETYHIKLRFPMQPCVVIAKNTLLPLELCFVVQGQRYGKKLDKQQTTDMISFTCQPPRSRANIIKQGLQILDYDNNEHLRDFGVKVSSEMVTVKGRLLPAPLIHYHPKSQSPHVTPQNGSWNLVGKKVVAGASLGAWGIVVFGNERDVPSSRVSHFVRELVVTCVDTGLFIVNKDPPISYVNPRGVIEEGLKKAWLGVGNSVKSQPQLLLCILPNTGVSLYAEIKRLTDTVIGVASQCVQVKHTQAPKKQYCANVCLKMNVKLGGMNSELAPTMLPVLKEKPTIIFGADVSHPAAGDSVRPSIAALVGSMDSKAARYATSIRIQTARTEVIVDLSAMVVELLKAFYQRQVD